MSFNAYSQSSLMKIVTPSNYFKNLIITIKESVNLEPLRTKKNPKRIIIRA